jgi:hypothetical protein
MWGVTILPRSYKEKQNDKVLWDTVNKVSIMMAHRIPPDVKAGRECEGINNRKDVRPMN